MEVLSPTKIVWIGDTGGSLAIDDKINKAPGKYRGFFKGWPAAPVMASLYITPLKYFLEKGLWKPKNRKAVVTVEDTDWGRSWGAAMKNKLAEIMEVVGMDAMPLDAVEHTPLLTRYQATGVSLVASTWTSDVTVSSFVKQFHAMGLKALLIADGITNVGEWYKLMGNASNGALNCALAVLTPDQKAWVARYREKYKAEPGLDTAGLAFDYTLMGIKGLSQAGTLQFDKVVRTFETLEYKGVWNLYKFSTAAGPRALAPHEVEVGDLMQGFFFPVEQMENGQAKVIWPLNYAAGAFVPPPGG
jgi:branched-chain amino acid transport system substrate-binding protein